MKGAPVAAGETLGLAGNSGNSSNPHTHIQCQRDSLSGPLRGMPFRDAWVLDRTRFNSANSNSLWVSLKADGIPQEAVAIWPSLWLPIRPFHEAAIDPLALILRGDVYVELDAAGPPARRSPQDPDRRDGAGYDARRQKARPRAGKGFQELRYPLGRGAQQSAPGKIVDVPRRAKPGAANHPDLASGGVPATA